jgi:hypothetical protein
VSGAASAASASGASTVDSAGLLAELRAVRDG